MNTVCVLYWFQENSGFDLLSAALDESGIADDFVDFPAPSDIGGNVSGLLQSPSVTVPHVPGQTLGIARVASAPQVGLASTNPGALPQSFRTLTSPGVTVVRAATNPAEATSLRTLITQGTRGQIRQPIIIKRAQQQQPGGSELPGSGSKGKRIIIHTVKPQGSQGSPAPAHDSNSGKKIIQVRQLPTGASSPASGNIKVIRISTPKGSGDGRSQGAITIPGTSGSNPVKIVTVKPQDILQDIPSVSGIEKLQKLQHVQAAGDNTRTDVTSSGVQVVPSAQLSHRPAPNVDVCPTVTSTSILSSSGSMPNVSETRILAMRDTASLTPAQSRPIQVVTRTSSNATNALDESDQSMSSVHSPARQTIAVTQSASSPSQNLTVEQKFPVPSTISGFPRQTKNSEGLDSETTESVACSETGTQLCQLPSTSAGASSSTSSSTLNAPSGLPVAKPEISENVSSSSADMEGICEAVTMVTTSSIPVLTAGDGTTSTQSVPQASVTELMNPDGTDQNVQNETASSANKNVATESMDTLLSSETKVTY